MSFLEALKREVDAKLKARGAIEYLNFVGDPQVCWLCNKDRPMAKNVYCAKCCGLEEDDT